MDIEYIRWISKIERKVGNLYISRGEALSVGVTLPEGLNTSALQPG